MKFPRRRRKKLRRQIKISVSDFSELQSRLGYNFRDENLLRLALTHPSVSHESPVNKGDNQRLEFLGDSLLRLVQSEILYTRFPGADEGVLSKARAALENEKALSARARLVNLGAHLKFGSGVNPAMRAQNSILADAFEAVLGAIFLDGGFEAAREFILREFAPDFAVLAEPSGIENPKGELQELLQSRSPRAPEYRTLSATGAHHDPDFECAVFHDGAELARGRGKSKKAAESEAALAALEKLRADKAV